MRTIVSSLRPTTALDACIRCGGALTAERWTSESSPVRESIEDGMRLRTIAAILARDTD